MIQVTDVDKIQKLINQNFKNQIFLQGGAEEPQALGEQPEVSVPGRIFVGGHPQIRQNPRSSDEASVLSDL